MTKATLITMVLASTLATACGDDDAGTGGGTTTSTTSTTSSTTSGATTTSGGQGGGGGAGGGELQVEVLKSFDAAQFQLPEGIVVRGSDLFLGFAFTSAVERFELDGSGETPFSTLPVPANSSGFMTGLTVDPAGDVYAALVSFTGDPVPGVYRVPAAGGAPVLFASHPSMVFPNGFAWDDAGTLFVTDSATGTILSIDSNGAATPWLADPILAGDPTACGGQADDLVVGANGVVWTGDALLVANSDKGLVARIPIEADGSAGAVETLAGPDCAKLAGIDGITQDEDGTLVAAINRADRLVRIDEDGAVTTLLEGAPLDFPASVTFAGSGDERALYVTSFALTRALAGEPASPALLRVRF